MLLGGNRMNMNSDDIFLRISEDIPFVTILLGTYNGERFLEEQLESIERQTHLNWILVASDDGSTDHTLEILKRYQNKWTEKKLLIRNGPQKGFCQNFLSLICDPAWPMGFYAFCDQDDIWLPNKLEVAINQVLELKSQELPILYSGRTRYVDEELQNCGFSPLFKRPPSFRNALVQSLAGGNTMLLNQAAKLLIEKGGCLPVVSHDWWAYQLVTGAGGKVIYDVTPYVMYRQHQNALVGGNTSMLAKLKRVQMLFEGRFKNWNTINLNSLTTLQDLLTVENKELLVLFEGMRKKTVLSRLISLRQGGFYRQTMAGTLSIIFAVLIKKV
jgi:glycosyltransferase involved in cell wall biosynthesis